MQDAEISVKSMFSNDKELDGVSHVESWNSAVTSKDIFPSVKLFLIEFKLVAGIYPRSNLLYNYYTNVDLYKFNMWQNGSFAIRDDQYKLIHTFDSSSYGAWYGDGTVYDSYSTVDLEDMIQLEDSDADSRCAPQLMINNGNFTVCLFPVVVVV